MQLTNKHGLPQALVNVITNSASKPGQSNRWSYSLLGQPPQITQLTIRHYDQLEEDVSERIWLLLGSAVHYILDKRSGNQDTERWLNATIADQQIVGIIDLYHDAVVTDYKITSVWTAVYEREAKQEWVEQLNTYAWLARQNGLDVEALQVCCILRDWQQSKAFASDYPAIPVKVYPVDLWPDEQAKDWITNRIELHIDAAGLPDSKLPECTLDEMWYKPGKFALMKKGRQKAVQLFEHMEYAERALLAAGNNHYIEKRSGKFTRCESYCSVSVFCHQKNNR